MGYTWDQLNAYDFPLLSASLRVGQFSSALSVVLDPLIYFWVNPDLRKAFRKTIGGQDTSISNWTNWIAIEMIEYVTVSFWFC